jgi:hypothetical protein
VILAGFAAAAGLTAAFVAAERRARDPLLPLALFRDRSFGGGMAIGLLINLGFYGQLFVTSLYLQNTRHMGPVTAGAALLPRGCPWCPWRPACPGGVRAARASGRRCSRACAPAPPGCSG